MAGGMKIEPNFPKVCMIHTITAYKMASYSCRYCKSVYEDFQDRNKHQKKCDHKASWKAMTKTERRKSDAEKTPALKVKKPKKTKEKKPKKTKGKIPSAIRHNVWCDWHGDRREGKCYCCSRETISIANHACGHIISEKNGGKIEISNLRPVCVQCNSSMGIQNMHDYMEKHGLIRPKRPNFPIKQREKGDINLNYTPIEYDSIDKTTAISDLDKLNTLIGNMLEDFESVK